MRDLHAQAAVGICMGATECACLQDWVDHEQVMLQRNLGPGCLHLPHIVFPGPVVTHNTAVSLRVLHSLGCRLAWMWVT